jgi:hypothetical protein
MNNSFYPIGQPHIPWEKKEKDQWFQQATRKRSYSDDVIDRIADLESRFDVRRYGTLPIDPERYPLFGLTTQRWKMGRPSALITGGVHGYETSGVHGALLFAEQFAEAYQEHFNLVIVPCVSPWGYETINRWNPNCIDPNRSFVQDSPSEEASQLMAFIAEFGDFLVHIDLHETTDSDEQEFRPALAARDGKDYEPGEIPDGFYTVGDTPNPQLEFQQAIIESVSAVTHIAPPDANGRIIGSDVVSDGVILYPMKELGLCGGMTDCRFGTTTEVYPDSPRATPPICNEAQVAAIRGALDYVINSL